MKFKTKIKIKASKEEIIAKISDRKNMGKWMKGFQSYELLNGEDLEVGSRALILLNIAGKKIEMKETILENNLPNSFQSMYEADGVTNYVNNGFKDLGENLTLWEQELDFHFKNLAVKMFSSLVVSLFKTLSKSILTDFKKFVEQEDE